MRGLIDEPATWVAIAFAIFIALFGGKLQTALFGLIDKRVDAVRTQLAEAQRLRQEAEAMLADAKTRREEAVTEAQALLQGAKAEADRLARAAATDAEAGARRREKMAMDRIAAAEKAAVDDIRIAAAVAAGQAAERVIRETLTADADGGLIDTAIRSLPAALAPKRAA